jgi:hypothetical protein
MCNKQDKDMEMKFKKLLSLFKEVLKDSKDYHIAEFSKLGYVAIIGEYLSGEDSDTVTSKLLLHSYFSSPLEMANSIMDNLRWRWFEENHLPVCTDDYKSFLDMDDELPKEKYPEYFQMLRDYSSEISGILGDTYKK